VSEHVILLHGLWMRGFTLAALRRRLEREGYSVELFDYASVMHKPEASIGKLVEHVKSIRAKSVHLVGHSLGGLIGAAGGTALLSSGLQPVAAAGVAALVAAVLLVLTAPGLVRSKSVHKAPLLVIPRGIVILVGTLAFIAFLSEGAILDWSALLLTGAFAVPTAQAGIGYALFSVAMILGRLTGDFVVKRLGQRKTLLWGGLTVTAGFALLLLLPVPLAACGFLLIGLGAANLVPILFSTAGRQSAMPPVLAVASITTLGYAGILVGPAAIGYIASLTSLRTAFAVLGLIMLGFPLFRARIPAAP